MRPPFITVEGIDGAGKSSHMDTLTQALNGLGFEVVRTAEPGGTKVGEELRMLIKQTQASAKGKAFMAFASRVEHLDLVIWPALAEGKAVISDRFTDSTFGYQGQQHQGGVPYEELLALEKVVHPGFEPDLTLLFDIDPEVAEARRNARLAAGTPADAKDVFDLAGNEFMIRAREGLLWRQARDPERFARIDAGQSFEAVQTQVKEVIEAFVHRFQAKQQAEAQPSARPDVRRRRPG
jgi:dTMP kinase